MHVLRVALCAAVFLLPSVLPAQTRVGIALGRSLVGSGGSRVPISAGSTNVLTGAGRPGWFGAVQVEAPISASAFSFRGELSVSRLGRDEQAISAVPGSTPLPTAAFDRSIGLSASLVAATSRSARLAPYAVMGIGLYAATLRGGPLNGTGGFEASGNGLGIQLGAGLRYRVGRANVLLESRLVQPMSNVRGTNYLPLTLGVQF